MSPERPKSMPLFSLTKLSKLTGTFRLMVGLVSALFLSLQVIAPNIGQAAEGGDWMEICSEFGVIEIQINAPQEDGSECTECDTCVMCSVQGPSTLEDDFSALKLASSKTLIFRTDSHVVRTNPAQFWHVSRGPPDLNKIAMARVFGASVVTTQNKEVALWT